MKKRKLKSWVVPALYMISIGVIFVSIMFIGRVMNEEYARAVDTDYIPSGLVTDEIDTTPVVEVKNEVIAQPFMTEGVNVAKDYYDRASDEETQVKSIIYYKDTYMENTGLLYSSTDAFDIVSVLDGNVTSVTTDEILGNVVEITHTTELTTIYHCLSEVNVQPGDTLKQGDVIGKSGKVNVDDGYENALLFEVNYRGEIINPNEFYKMNVKDIEG